jgi:hypothetical protein
MTTTWKDLRRKVAVAVNKARPVTSAVERVANLAVHLRSGITPMGAIGLASAAVNAVAQSMNEGVPCSPSTMRGVCCSMTRRASCT